MKKRIFALFLTLIMIFAFSTICFAASSPQATVLPTENQETTGSGSGLGDDSDSGNHGNQNTSSVSPKTGYQLGESLMIMFASLGVAVVSMKKYSEC